MLELIFRFNWLNGLLVIFTCILVATDRAFSRKVRREFHMALIGCFIVSLVGQHVILLDEAQMADSFDTIGLIQNLLRPVVLYLIVLASEVITKKAHEFIFAIPLVINAILAIAGFNKGSIAICCLYMLLFIVAILAKSRRGDKTNYVFAATIFMMLIAALCSEIMLGINNLLNFAISIISCIFYYYRVMNTYKRDHLTGLLIRHNLNYEMADLINAKYDVVLIDVDNFKLINDKYGHDRGDEVLVTIVNTVRDHLLKGCRMFRFGGDEFVIISTKVSKEQLTDALENANSQLSLQDLHMSFGIVTHNPGDDSAEVLAEADKVMYENKRSLKSESIWDDMTGLYNYRGFLDEMEVFGKALERENHRLSLVGVDIEQLNNINMAYGYTEGNLVIATLARVLKTCLRGRDFIGHLGSDEFVVALECEGDNDAYVDKFIKLVNDTMDSAYELTGKDYTVKLNMAKYLVEYDSELTDEDFVNNVLYLKQEEKENRRKTDLSGDDQDYSNQDEQAVLDILDNNRLKYAFQPIVSAKDGSIVAYETLMRSATEEKISPLKILKYAERNKRVYDVEKYTFFNVLNLVSAMKDFPEDRKIFVNSIPGYSLSDEDYNVLKNTYGNLMKRMVMEITEQREIDDDTLAIINARRDKDGFNLAIDDYGSGCSNTNSLLRYNPRVVKLDRLLITGIDRNAKKQFFVNSIITFARENSMLILAEGVETESELKTVIRLGADLIQGYFTAKPSFDILDEIPAEKKKIIIDENLKVGEKQRKVYTASKNGELSVVHLAMEDYSKVNVTAETLKITGSIEYTADMVIRIKEGITCELTLTDVKLNSVDDEPCIDVGEGAHLTLILEGQSRLNAKGIRVPDGSSLTVKGTGNIEILVKGHQCYCIGNNTESGFGKLYFMNSGSLILNADGENCVCIGGGRADDNSLIEITGGRFDVNVAGVDAVGIGYYTGQAPINIKDCEIVSNFRVNSGTVIGTMGGIIDINIKNYFIDVMGSGTLVCGIGSAATAEGTINIDSGTYKVKINGQKISLIGSEAGEVKISAEHSRLEMVGEGDNAMGFGSFDMKATVSVIECSLDLVINASGPLAFGSENTDVHVYGPLTNVMVNGNPYVWD